MSSVREDEDIPDFSLVIDAVLSDPGESFVVPSIKVMADTLASDPKYARTVAIEKAMGWLRIAAVAHRAELQGPKSPWIQIGGDGVDYIQSGGYFRHAETGAWVWFWGTEYRNSKPLITVYQGTVPDIYVLEQDANINWEDILDHLHRKDRKFKDAYDMMASYAAKHGWQYWDNAPKLWTPDEVRRFIATGLEVA